MFRFKRFVIEQGGAAMKVGTDGVLLGAWCRIEPRQRRILDVGCGTGLIALMAAQRSEGWRALVDAVEIDTGAYGQACENVAASPWADRVAVYHAPFQDFAADAPGGGYDHIVSNPPFFRQSLRSPDAARRVARHADALPFDRLAAGVARLLGREGLFSTILPADSFGDFVAAAGMHGLHPARVTSVRTTAAAAAPKRMLAEFTRRPADPLRTSLTVHQGPAGEYSREYAELTIDF